MLIFFNQISSRLLSFELLEPRQIQVVFSHSGLIFSSTIFFSISEFNALTPTPRPVLSIPVVFSAFVPCFVMVSERLPPRYALRFLWFLGPTCLVLVIVAFLGRFLLLTLSYLARNNCPFGSRTCCGIVCLLNKIFCSGISASASSTCIKYFFFKTGSTTEPSSGPAKDPSMAPTGKKILFCVRLLHFPPIYQTPLLNDSFLILKSHRLVARCYVIVT